MVVRSLLVLLAVVGAGCAGADAARPAESVACSPGGALQLAPPVVAVAPSEPTEGPALDWNAVADSVTYPELARRAQVGGGVAATVRVTDAGRASSVEVHGLVGAEAGGSAPESLVRAAADGLMRARYRPVGRDAVGRASEVDVIVVFRSRALPPCGS